MLRIAQEVQNLLVPLSATLAFLGVSVPVAIIWFRDLICLHENGWDFEKLRLKRPRSVEPNFDSGDTSREKSFFVREPLVIVLFGLLGFFSLFLVLRVLVNG